jgi:hypothetical protein
MGKMSKKDLSNNELSQAEISNLIYGENLLSGIPSPFETEYEREQAYLAHESELIEIFSRRRKGFRPALFWKFHEKQKIGTAARVKPGGVARLYDIYETDSQFLERTGLGLPHERSAILGQAQEDREQQSRLMANSREWLAKGEGARIEHRKEKGKEGGIENA